MNEQIAIKVEDVYKDFTLPLLRVNSVKSLFTGVFKRSGTKKKVRQQALRDISFEVKKGEFFGIVGRNGSGKSTMLKILASIYQPSKGKVTIQGKLVPFIELGVGFNPELTGRENVFLNGAMLGFSRKEISLMYDDIVAFAELEQFMDQKLKNYSSGMQVRLAFSMATRAEADILLIDEVLAVGDADFQRKCFEYFKRLKRNGKTVVFVSHDMSAVREYCDRAIMIEKSNVVASGNAEKIAAKYTRMFLRERTDQSKTESAETLRWGDRVLTFDKPIVEKVDDDEVVLVMNVKANKDCEDPSFGFVVKNGSGETLMGTNTTLQNIKPAPVQAGQRLLVRWLIPNIFSEGEYDVTIAAQYNNGLTPGDWWEDGIHFRIEKKIHTPYRVQPNVIATVESVGVTLKGRRVLTK